MITAGDAKCSSFSEGEIASLILAGDMRVCHSKCKEVFQSRSGLQERLPAWIGALRTGVYFHRGCVCSLFSSFLLLSWNQILDRRWGDLCTSALSLTLSQVLWKWLRPVLKQLCRRDIHQQASHAVTGTASVFLCSVYTCSAMPFLPCPSHPSP